MNWWLQFIGVKDVHSIYLLSNALNGNLDADRLLALGQAANVVKSHFA